MNDLGIRSVMLDTSFCIRLLDKNDPLHQNALEYFKYFLLEKISMHLSTIAVAEYAVGDAATNLPINHLQIEAFDFLDAQTAGTFHKVIKGTQENILHYNRRIIVNDVKIFAQVSTKKIEASISKDVNSVRQYLEPLEKANLLQVHFLDLNVPLHQVLGKLF